MKFQRMLLGCVRKDRGPVFIEFVTYRLRGHVGPDDNIQGTHRDIRPKEEIEKWRKKDPIRRFETFLIKNKIFRKETLERIDREVEEEVKGAHEFAKESPYPNPNELTKYVFKELESVESVEFVESVGLLGFIVFVGFVEFIGFK